MISRGQMNRQLYGLGSLNRQKYGFGDFVRKIIPNELAEIGSKAAPIVSLFNPALGAGIGALSEYDKSGSLKDALKTAAFDYVLGQAGQKFGTGEFQGSPFQKGNFKETMTTFNNPFKNIFTNTGSTGKETMGEKIGKFFSSAKEGIKDTKVSDLMKNDLIRLLLVSPTYFMGKKDAEEKRRLEETKFNKYMAEKEAFAKKLETPSELRGYRVARTPTLTDIVRQPVMGGGIMNTRKGYNMGSVGAGFEGLFQDTIGTTMLGPNIEDEIMRRARKFMQMTDDVDAAYKMAEMEFMSELESKYPGFYEEIGTLPQDLNEKDYRGRMGYAGGTIDKDYEAWKRMYEKSQDAAEGLNPIKNQEYIQRYKQEKNNRTKYAIGGDTSEPISSFEQNTMMAGPDWYVKRVEILMELGYDYETASEIAFDSNLYDDAVGGMNKGGRSGYALGDTATMAAQVEGLPLRNNQAGITELDLRDSGGFIPTGGINPPESLKSNSVIPA